MKNRIKSILLISILILIGCDKIDNEIVPIKKSSINLSGLQNGDVVWNTVMISIDMEGKSNIDRIEIDANNTLIRAFDNTAVEFSIDTRKYEDGSLKVKAVAYSKENEELSSSLLELKINNTLVNLSLEQGYFEGKDHVFYILTDKENNILGYSELQDENTYVIPRPQDFEDSLFHTHLLSIVKSTGSNFHGFNLKTTLNVTPGRINFRDNFYNQGEQISSIDVAFKDIPIHTSFELQHPGGGSWSLSLTESRSYKPVFSNQDDIYVLLENNGSYFYKYFRNLLDANSHILSLQDMNSDFDILPFSMPAGFNLSTFRVQAIHGSSIYDRSDIVVSTVGTYFDSKSFDLLIPMGIPQHESYATEMSYYNDSEIDKTYRYRAFGIPNTVDPYEANIEIINTDPTNLEFSITGEYDRYFCDYGNFNLDEKEVNSWHTIGFGAPSFEFPLIPEAILAKYPNIKIETLLKYEGFAVAVEVKDWTHIDDYNDFLQRSFGRGDKLLYDDFTFEQTMSVRKSN